MTDRGYDLDELERQSGWADVDGHMTVPVRLDRLDAMIRDLRVLSELRKMAAAGKRSNAAPGNEAVCDYHLDQYTDYAVDEAKRRVDERE